MSGQALDTGLYAGTGTFKKDGMVGAYMFAGAGLTEDKWSIFGAEAREPNVTGVDSEDTDEDTDEDTSDYLRGVNRPRARDRARARVHASAIAYARANLASARAPAHPPRSRFAASVAYDSADWIKNIDRPVGVTVNDVYAGALAYGGADKAGVYVRAGVGHARAECGPFDAEVKGANVEVRAEVSETSLSVCARAELASVSVSDGPLKATVGLSADTGVKVGPECLEAEVLGTGVKLGRTMGLKLFGTGIEFKLF